MSKTQQQFYDEIYNPGKEGLDKLHQEKKKNNDQTYQQIEQAIDEQAATSAGVYEKRKAQAPAEYQQYYDENAINEAFTRKQVAESMANMGAVNSGLNESSQVAISLQRNNADAAVQKKQREYVQNLQSAIDQIYTAAETEKKTQKAAMDTQLQEWYDSALLGLENSSREAAATAWGAQEESEAAKYAAEQDRLARIAEAQNDWSSSVGKSATDYALQLIKSGAVKSESEAWSIAAQRFGLSKENEDGVDPEEEQYEKEREYAKSVIGDKNVLGGLSGGYDTAQVRWFRTDRGEAKALVSEVTKELETMAAYNSASDIAKRTMVAYATANALKASRKTVTEQETLLPYFQEMLTRDQWEIFNSEF